MNKPTTILLLAVSIALTACGGGDPEDQIDPSMTCQAGAVAGAVLGAVSSGYFPAAPAHAASAIPPC